MKTSTMFLLVLITFVVCAWILVVGVLFAINPLLLGLPALVLSILIILNVILRSIFLLKPNETLHVFLLAAVHVYSVTPSDYMTNEANQAWAQRWPELAARVYAGIFGGLALSFWPILVGRVVSADNQRADIKTGGAFTADSDDSARVPLSVNCTLNFVFSPVIIEIIKRLQGIGRLGSDLTIPCSATGNDGKDYLVSRLTILLREILNSQVLEAIRNAVSHFTWRGENDVLKKRNQLELMVYYFLRWPNSVIVDLGIFTPQMPTNDLDADLAQTQKNLDADLAQTQEDLDSGALFGPCVIKFDLTIEEIKHDTVPADSSEAAKADQTLFVAKQNALAAATTGKGEGLALQALADATNGKVTARDKLVSNVVAQSKPNVVTVDKGILDTFEKIISPK